MSGKAANCEVIPSMMLKKYHDQQIQYFSTWKFHHTHRLYNEITPKFTVSNVTMINKSTAHRRGRGLGLQGFREDQVGRQFVCFNLLRFAGPKALVHTDEFVSCL